MAEDLHYKLRYEDWNTTTTARSGAEKKTLLYEDRLWIVNRSLHLEVPRLVS